MLSPNVINTVKWLTSGYLFKSRHQTHSFFFFYLHKSQKLLSREKGVFRSAQRPARLAKQGLCSQHSSLHLFHHLQRERAMPAPSSARTRPLTVRRTMNSGAGGGSGLIVTDDVTAIRPWHCQTPGRGSAGQNEGGRQNANSDEGLGDMNGGCVSVCAHGTGERNKASR